MSADAVVDAMRVGWLTLAVMMLVSRVVFQAKGALWMRSFLDGWQGGAVKRGWGAVSLAFAGFLVIAGTSVAADLRALDVVLLAGLVLVLLTDGLVNVTAGAFAAFKDEMQRRWVARTRGAGREGDRHLFGTVNAALALASLAVATLVIAYRPIDVVLVAAAVALGTALAGGLIAASARRG